MGIAKHVVQVLQGERGHFPPTAAVLQQWRFVSLIRYFADIRYPVLKVTPLIGSRDEIEQTFRIQLRFYESRMTAKALLSLRRRFCRSPEDASMYSLFQDIKGSQLTTGDMYSNCVCKGEHFKPQNANVFSTLVCFIFLSGIWEFQIILFLYCDVYFCL